MPENLKCRGGRISSLISSTALSLLILLVMTSALNAQDWREKLTREVVVIKEGKMLYEAAGLVKINVEGYEPFQFQVKIRSEAPAKGVISRDNFVALTTQVFLMNFIVGIAEEYEVPASAFLEGFNYVELAKPIGNPDVEMNIAMTAEGIQVEIVNKMTGERTSRTMTWAQIFKQ